MNGVSPSGKATVFGIVIRWFESSHPSHYLFKSLIFKDFLHKTQVNKLASANVGC